MLWVVYILTEVTVDKLRNVPSAVYNFFAQFIYNCANWKFSPFELTSKEASTNLLEHNKKHALAFLFTTTHYHLLTFQSPYIVGLWQA